MIRCPTCGTLNQDSRRACTNCGAALPQTKIRCSKCGTLNPVGNLFCDQCNARLIQAEDVVPVDLPSEDESVSDSAVKGISLPTRSASGQDDLGSGDLPDWLRGIAEDQFAEDDDVAPAAPDAVPDWAAASSDEAGEDASLGWLSDLLDEGADAPAEDLPEGGATTISASPSEDDAAADDWASWFSDDAGGEDVASGGDVAYGDEAASMAGDGGFEDADAFDLFDDTTSSQPVEAGDAALPSWLMAFADPSPGGDEMWAQGQDELPDWLMATADADPFPEEPPMPPVPDWLGGEAGGEVMVGASGSHDAGGFAGMPDIEQDEDVPDWLAAPGGVDELEPTVEPGVSDEDEDDGLGWLSFGAEEDAAGEEDLEAPVVSDDELPDWLAAPGGVDELEPAAGPDTPEGEDDGLGWLFFGAEEEADGAEDVEAPVVSDDELPDWLASSSAFDEAAEAVPEATSQAASQGRSLDEEDAPSWLSMLDEGDGGATSDEAADEQADAFAMPFEDEAGADELPDWLSEAGALSGVSAASDSDALGEADEGLPDWLASYAGAEESSEGEAPVEAASASDLAETAEPEAGEALPEWLATLGVESSDAGGASVFTDTEEPEAAQTAAPGGERPQDFLSPEDEALSQPTPLADMPSWLQDVAPPSEARPSAPAFVEDQDAGAVPVELAAEPEPMPSEGEGGAEEMPGWLKDLEMSAPEAPDAGATVGPESLAHAELPSWLQDLVPSDQQGGGLEGEELAPADIPDWVQALRPQPREDGSMPSGPLSPAESEGPLENLPGLLSASSTVDLPPDIKPGVIHELPDVVVEQGQLWLQLLEQPRSSERPVTQARAGQAGCVYALRLIVALVLIAVSVLAVLPLLPGRLAQTPLSELAPGVPPLVQGLDTLQTGDQVVVAFDFSPSYATEMTEVARPILDHLKEREVNLIVVSTLPEGVGLGASMSGQVAVTETTGMIAGGYLAGNASGVADFLHRVADQDVRYLIVLTSHTDRLRWWVEQNQALQGREGTPLPMNVGVTSALRPLVAPYLESAGVEGWIAGLPQALAYHEARGVDTAKYDTALNALMLGQWAAAVFLIFGLIYALIAGRKGKR